MSLSVNKIDCDEDEPLLKENPHRFTLFPIQHKDVWDMYQKQFHHFWTPAEIDLAGDRSQYDELDSKEQHFLLTVLAFFAGSDGIVNENLAINFYQEIQIPEVRSFYGFQVMMENVHSEVYSQLIDFYVKSPAQKEELFQAIERIPCIKRKADWAIKHFDRSRASFGRRLVAFACVEGIFFSASFCAIFWFKKRGKLPGLCFSNELISRDEGLHCDFACLLYRNYVQHKLTQDELDEMIKDVVDIEGEFVRHAMPEELIGMNASLMIRYIRFCANRLARSLGHSAVFTEDCDNPYDWMELISMDGKTNFFEKRVGEYAKPTVSAYVTEKFTTDEVF